MTNIQKIACSLPAGVDAAVITDADVRFRLTGFRSSAGTLLVSPAQCRLFVDFRYIEAAQAAVSSLEVLLSGKLEDQIKETLSGIGAHTVAFLDDKVSVAESRRLTAAYKEFNCLFEPELSELLAGMAMIKSPEEQSRIKAAQKITDGAFVHMLKWIRAGMSELEVSRELESVLRRLGAEGNAFDPIVVSGANSSKPHGVPTEKILENGDFLTMDFGAKAEGYCSDMTRTICIGQPSEEMVQVYDTVLKAQRAALAAVRPGVRGNEIDKIARDIIYGAGYEGCFGHGLGHSLGVLIHEPPRFAPGDQTVIQPGMALTVEPGIYLAGRFGVRIEDLVIVTENGCENITESPKERIIL